MQSSFFKDLLLTSEAVGAGHPDKICDQIADLILEEYLLWDKNARVACEVFAGDKVVFIGGEITSSHHVDVKEKAYEILRKYGYNCQKFEIISRLRKQSQELSVITGKYHHLNVSDQCITVGFASNETKQLMPIGFVLSQDLIREIDILRVKNPQIKHDMKSQVTVYYDENGKVSIDNVLISVQHGRNIDSVKLRELIVDKAINTVAKKYKFNTNFKKFVNPAGKFVLGGLRGDTGLTGRKVVVDTYGLYSRHGGGALSGKDPTKIDRTGSYYARWIAKHIVASGIADICEIQLGWRIGTNVPISISVDCFGTNKIEIKKVVNCVRFCFCLNFEEIIDKFCLLTCKYSQLSVYGHFGRDEEFFRWEKIDDSIIEKLRSLLDLKNVTKVKYMRKI